MPPLAVVIAAPNGVGHLRRVIGVMSEFHQRRPDVEIVIAAEEWQRDQLGAWERADSLWRSGARLVAGIMSPGVAWSQSPETYDDGRLLAWEARLAASGVVGEADLVVSDNLAGVLGLRPDAVLMGSFLWSDVLAAAYSGHAAVDGFAQHERLLLATHRPDMLCVADVAMEGVLERTAAVRLAWMCESAFTGDTRRGRGIAVLGGRTGAADALLTRVARALERRGVTVVEPFGYTGADFAAVDAVVCRPGLGTVTDCVAARTPVVALHERANVEMAHIGSRIASLGLGRYLGADPSDDEVIDAVADVLAPATAAAIRARMEALPTDGLSQAALWLVRHLEQQRGAA